MENSSVKLARISENNTFDCKKQRTEDIIVELAEKNQQMKILKSEIKALKKEQKQLKKYIDPILDRERVQNGGVRFSVSGDDCVDGEKKMCVIAVLYDSTTDRYGEEEELFKYRNKNCYSFSDTYNEGKFEYWSNPLIKYENLLPNSSKFDTYLKMEVTHDDYEHITYFYAAVNIFMYYSPEKLAQEHRDYINKKFYFFKKKIK